MVGTRAFALRATARLAHPTEVNHVQNKMIRPGICAGGRESFRHCDRSLHPGLRGLPSARGSGLGRLSASAARRPLFLRLSSVVPDHGRSDEPGIPGLPAVSTGSGLAPCGLQAQQKHLLIAAGISRVTLQSLTSGFLRRQADVRPRDGRARLAAVAGGDDS